MLARRLLHLFPSPLPKGHAEFKAFLEDLYTTYDIPPEDAYKQAVATMIMHLGPTVHRKSRRFFYKSIRKAQANQVAYEMIKQAQEAKREATLTETSSEVESMADAGPQDASTTLVSKTS